MFAPKDRWADIILPRSRFLKTWRGRVMEHHYEMSASKVTGLGIAIAGGGDIEPEGPFRLEVASITGLRLSPEELEKARRKSEAAWGVAAGPDLALAAQGLRRSLIDVEKEAAAAAAKKKKKKTEWVGGMLPSFLGSKGHKEEDNDEENDDEGGAGSHQRREERG